MAGVMASYASLGDVIIAEPEALIGFAGPRVIKETTQQDLPEGFQTSEFLLERGLVDMIVSRLEMRDRMINIMKALYGANSVKLIMEIERIATTRFRVLRISRNQNSMPDYSDILDYLYALKNKGSKYGIERMHLLVQALGHPEQKFPVIHVAGTNGKGSVCAMLEAIYRDNGYRVGLFSSPHLVQSR